MKLFAKTAFAAALLSSSLVSTAVLAEQKIGVVSVENIFRGMPQAATIQQDIAAEFKDQTEEINKLEKDIRYYLEKNQRDAATMSADEKQELEQTIISKRQEYETKAKPLQEDIQRRLAEERNKLLGMIKQSVDFVSAEEKMDMVLNANAVAYIKPDLDISQKVLDHVSKIK